MRRPDAYAARTGMTPTTFSTIESTGYQSPLDPLPGTSSPDRPATPQPAQRQASRGSPDELGELPPQGPPEANQEASFTS